ncbi:hypothetical protein [Neptunomonas sp.]|uniref:hypothetical protein n=1 Tax=Neptunomonas sp. TaxID=1971898 RepID=UPI0035688A87
MASTAQAYSLFSQDGTEINLDIEAVYGIFSSNKNYSTLGEKTEGSSDWQEGYIKYGLSGSNTFGTNSSFYAGLNLVSSGTWGDGDAAGFTNGSERETELEDAYLGWRSGNIIPVLGPDGLDISLGRQNFVIGDGFLVNGDALNFGKAFNGSQNRGGGYWLAPRKAFDRTTIVRIGGSDGLRGDLFWLKSDNLAQAETEMAGINVEYVNSEGAFGLTYMEGLDVNEHYGYDYRDSQQTLSLRYQGNAGVENLFLSGEFVTQDQGNENVTGVPDADAWYLEAGWSFVDLPWSPSLNYRYASFGDGYDPLFYGFNRGYGTWFQGEVGGSYAGPFNSGADIQHLAVRAAPTEMLSLGMLYYNFSDTENGIMDGQELDLYAEWVVTPSLILSPLIGFYKPDNSISTQLGENGINVYAQMIAIVPF